MGMAEETEIGWTWTRKSDGTPVPGATFNHVRGCTKEPLGGCDNCYADAMSGRNPAVLGIWGKDGTRAIAAESYWAKPLKWNADAVAGGYRKRVFCASLADVFEGEDTMPESAWEAVRKARQRLWSLIHITPQLDWLLLTKRPQNVMRMVVDDRAMFGEWPNNVWLGTSVENQAAADLRIPHLVRIPAKVRFLSMEPLLGPVDLRNIKGVGEVLYHCEVCGQTGVDPGEPLGIARGGLCPECSGLKAIDWVITGGESGPKARPSHPDWFRAIRDQCAEAGVPFYHKQNGEYVPVPWPMRDGPCVRVGWDGRTTTSLSAEHEAELDGWPWLCRVGKRAAGRMLDGKIEDGQPD
jgi:protein gp37